MENKNNNQNQNINSYSPDSSDNDTQKMSKEEIKKRLSGRASEYLMFLDDDE